VSGLASTNGKPQENTEIAKKKRNECGTEYSRIRAKKGFRGQGDILISEPTGLGRKRAGLISCTKKSPNEKRDRTFKGNGQRGFQSGKMGGMKFKGTNPEEKKTVSSFRKKPVPRK